MWIEALRMMTARAFCVRVWVHVFVRLCNTQHQQLHAHKFISSECFPIKKTEITTISGNFQTLKNHPILLCTHKRTLAHAHVHKLFQKDQNNQICKWGILNRRFSIAFFTQTHSTQLSMRCWFIACSVANFFMTHIVAI